MKILLKGFNLDFFPLAQTEEYYRRNGIFMFSVIVSS